MTFLFFPQKKTPQSTKKKKKKFGPLIPITTFKTKDEIFKYVAESNYGQQASIFGQDSSEIAPLIDVLVNQVSGVYYYYFIIVILWLLHCNFYAFFDIWFL